MEPNANSLSSKNPQRNMLVLAIIVGIAVIAVGLVIFLASNPQTVTLGSYEGIPFSRLPDGGFVLGHPDARVTIVEFADFACTACITYLEATEQFINEYVKTGRARFEYRIVPTAGRELTAFLGEIAVCLDEQREGAFWQAKDRLFQMAATGSYNGDSGRTVAQNLGLDYSEALECARTGDQVATDTQLANRAGVTGTPAVMMRLDNGEPTWIKAGGQQLNRGGVPYQVLASVVESNS